MKIRKITVISFKISKADAGLKKKNIQNHPLKLQYHKLDEEILKSQVVRFAINIEAPMSMVITTLAI